MSSDSPRTVSKQTITVRADPRGVAPFEAMHWIDHGPSGPSRAYLQEALGGLIQRVPLRPEHDGVTMWVSLKRGDCPLFPRNQSASDMAGIPVHGDVVLVREKPSNTPHGVEGAEDSL